MTLSPIFYDMYIGVHTNTTCYTITECAFIFVAKYYVNCLSTTFADFNGDFHVALLRGMCHGPCGVWHRPWLGSHAEICPYAPLRQHPSPHFAVRLWTLKHTKWGCDWGSDDDDEAELAQFALQLPLDLRSMLKIVPIGIDCRVPRRRMSRRMKGSG